MRRVYLISGIGFLALGIVGVFVPLLPATPFLLLAAGCFSRSSQRLNTYLLNHPTLGPPVMAWRRSGAISKRAKTWAFIAIMVSSLIVFSNKGIPGWGFIGYSLVISGVLIFIFTRPNE